MPFEARSTPSRLANPPGRRDRSFLAAVAGAALLGILACAFVYARHAPAPAGANCVVVAVPGSLGGTTLRNCGVAARDFCRSEARLNRSVADACARWTAWSKNSQSGRMAGQTAETIKTVGSG